MYSYRPRILTFVSHYLPGYRAGGPLRTIESIVDRLHDEFDFRIVTRDRDVGDTSPYPNIKIATWQKVGNAHVYYLPEDDLTSFTRLRQHINELEYDVVYLNSYFDTTTILYLLLRRFKLVPNAPVILAPRGELSEGARSLKSHKKMFYIWFAKMLRLHFRVLWHASSAQEKVEIEAIHPNADVHVALDLSSANLRQANDQQHRENQKEPGKATIVFLSRITPKKQLHVALEMLRHVKGQMQFDIYGPIRDAAYWNRCQTIMETLPDNVSASYQGEIPHEHVVQTLSSYHLFFMPTLSENYGQVILEALVAGCPVLISDTTPWRDLETKHVGWDVDLNDQRGFINVLNNVVAMDDATFKEWSKHARHFGQNKLIDEKVVNANRRLFWSVSKAD